MTRRSVIPAAPVGQQGTSRARRCVSCGGTPQRARVPLLTTGTASTPLDAKQEY